jgi:hypothetical protein
MQVSAKGTVQNLTRHGGTLKSASALLRSCVGRALRKARFAKRSKGSMLRFSIVFGSSSLASIFGQGGLPLTTGKKAGPSSGLSTLGTGSYRPRPVRVSTRLHRNIIRRVIRRRTNQVKYCYQKVLMKHPKAKGRLVARFIISGSGRVSNAYIAQSTFKVGRAQIAACISREILRWRFPKPKGGGKVVVSYPFVFTAHGDVREVGVDTYAQKEQIRQLTMLQDGLGHGSRVLFQHPARSASSVTACAS